jgi:hypothetical protein
MGVKCPKCHYENPDDTAFCGKCGGRLHSPEEAEVTKTLETPKKELTTGATFANRYQIIEELGKGGMGKVYRALDKELNEEIALKLIKPEIAQHKKSIERFKSEIRLANKATKIYTTQKRDISGRSNECFFKIFRYRFYARIPQSFLSVFAPFLWLSLPAVYPSDPAACF